MCALCCIGEGRIVIDEGGEIVNPKAKPDWKLYIALLLAVTVIFFCLYHDCIFGGKMYAYSDIGADTIDQYLPVMVYETEMIRDGNASGYDLRYGLGDYQSSQLYKYLNPVDLPILLLGEANLAAGILISAYLKYCAISILALLFFLHLFRQKQSAAICALLWTYSGYVLLWGQHYRFLTVMLVFTGAMYGMQLFLEGDKKRFLLIPLLALLTGTSYYFLYTSCFFFAVYGVSYLLFMGKSWKIILKKALWFALAMVPALCIGGVYLVPAVADFFSSARVAEVAGAAGEASAFYSPSYILCLMGRFLSANILGSGSGYRGPTNYYEMAILSVSLLSLFSLTLLLTGKHRMRVLFLFTLGTALVCMPGFNRIIVFSETNQRWTYLLCFAQVILIGFGLKELFGGEKCSLKRRVFSVLSADFVIFGILGAMWYMFHRFGVLLDSKACGLILLFAVTYSLLILMGSWLNRPWMVAAILVAAELILTGYGIVNSRSLVTLDQWYGGMYYDGTETVVNWLKDRDSSLYRVNKTYDSVRQNDAMIQGYHGLGVYLSTNSEELVNLYQSYGYPLMLGNRTNWVRFAGDDLLANVMLGVKYVITPEGEEMDAAYYEKIHTMEGFSVWQNRYFTGFGYLYAAEEPAVRGTRLEKLLGLSGGCHLTGDGAENGEGSPDGVLTLDLPLMPSGTFVVPDIQDGWLLSGLKVTLEAAQPSDLRLYQPDGTLVDQVYYGAGETVCYLDAVSLSEGCYIEGGPVDSVQLVLVNEEILLVNLRMLTEIGMQDMRQSGSRFTGRITNPDSQTGMLCVPLIYSDNWSAYVDGVETTVHNINGGLVGIRLPAGDHQVTIAYHDSTHVWGSWLTAVSFVLYLMGSALWLKQSVRKEDNR